MSENNVVQKGKRGRKSKKELMESLNLATKSSVNENITINVVEKDKDKDTEEIVEEKVAKKRGRKPKGGKIVENTVFSEPQSQPKTNVILYLKCFLKDLDTNTEEIQGINSFNTNYDLLEDHNNSIIAESPQQIHHAYFTDTNIVSNNVCMSTPIDNNFIPQTDQKEVWKKLKQLEYCLHTNNVNDKKSACFWCTYEFDNPAVYIPKYHMKDTYHVYGCFCSPECAVAYLTKENIDSSIKFERYHFLNHIYGKIYDYKKSIKPAPDPYYMLDKYYGNLNIQEYRALLSNERLYFIVDKPLTKILPELHEDNEDFILNNKIIPSSTYNLKKKLNKKHLNKTSIVNEKFGLSQG